MIETREWISLGEFAARIGATVRAVHKAIARGRITAITFGPQGDICAIDAGAAMKEWRTNADLPQRIRRRAWELAQERYGQYRDDLAKAIREGSLDAAAIDSWQPHVSKGA